MEQHELDPNPCKLDAATLQRLADLVSRAHARTSATGVAIALIEGWRGVIAHIVRTGADGGVAEVKVIDPSFRNWKALELAVRGAQVSDFPLCNKSFDLSYAGHDL